MNKKYIFKAGLLVVLCILSTSLLFSNLANADEELKLYTSIYPLQEAAERVGGEKININLLIEDGQEVHGSELSPGQIAAVESADLFFYVGIGLEPWADQLVTNLEELGVRTVRVSKGVDLRKFSDSEHDHSDSSHDNNEHHDNNDHRHEQDHDHGKYDPHIWLDLFIMQEIGMKMKEEFIELDPENEEYYTNNYQDFASELEELDKSYREKLNPDDEAVIMVSHEAFGYLGDRYGFRQLSVTGVSPHAEPGFGTIVDLVEKAEKYNLNYIFKEVLASPRIVEVLKEEADLEVLVLNPLEGLTKSQREAEEDYFSIMKQNLKNLKKAIGE